MAVETRLLDDDRAATTGRGRTAPTHARVRRPHGRTRAWVDAVRVHLARDSRVRPEVPAATDPSLGGFRAPRAALDARSVLAPDLSRRLDL
ncbi:hypothetical protein [Streptomyces sp. adm13(2018)]|uniref:hypothetical protein n=1 Tax=Streptomyces sp. adm13(2018) TaxID=2479007 RepID=UPI00164FAB3B|nr:hypothetical protein [Streptomyces sp. adm13(2018)]